MAERGARPAASAADDRAADDERSHSQGRRRLPERAEPAGARPRDAPSAAASAAWAGWTSPTYPAQELGGDALQRRDPWVHAAGGAAGAEGGHGHGAHLARPGGGPNFHPINDPSEPMEQRSR
eukprot:6994412-Pyramimonas_sp.AAC.1